LQLKIDVVVGSLTKYYASSFGRHKGQNVADPSDTL
jgi:hypothetical protein